MNSLFTVALLFKAIDAVTAPVRKINDALGSTGKEADKAASKMDALLKKTEKLGKAAEKLEGLGKPLAAVGTVGALGIGKTIVDFANLEEAQKALKTTLMDQTGKVGPEFEKLNALAEKLGAALPGSTKDMIEMFIALRNQGVQTKNILGGMGEATAKFSVLMKIPFAEGATHVAKFSESMGVAETDSVRFMDLLQRLKYASGVEVGDLAYTFKYAGGSLKLLGLQGLEAAKDFSTIVGVLAAAGIEGSTAGTNMAQALSRMAEIGHRLDRGQVKKMVGPVLDKYNIKLDFFTAKGEFKGLRPMVEQLEKLKALNPQEQIIVLKKLFGDEAARPLAVLLKSGVAGYDEILKRIKTQADMQTKINEIMSGTKNLWETMTGTVQNLTAYAGSVFAKLINLPVILEKINELFDRTSRWALLHPKTVGIIGGIIFGVVGLSLAAGTLLLTLGLMGTALPKAIEGIAMLGKVAASTSGVIRSVTASTKAFVMSTQLMQTVTRYGGISQAMPYMLLTAKLRIMELNSSMNAWIAAQLRSVKTGLVQYFDRLPYKLLTTKLRILEATSAMNAWIMAQLRSAKTGLIQYFDRLPYLLLTTKLRILEAVGAMRLWVIAQAAAFRAQFLTLFGLKALSIAFGSSLLNGMKAAYMGIRAFSVALATNPVGIIALAISTAAFLIYKYWGPISGFFKGLWMGIKEGLKGLEPCWKGFRIAWEYLSPLLTPLRWIWSLIKALFKPVDDTGKAAENMGVRWGKAISCMLTWVLTLPTRMLQGGINIVESLYKGMMSVIDKPINAIKSMTDKIRRFLPFSPAKEGALKDIHKIRLIETIADTVKPAPLMKAMRTATAAAMIAVTPVMPATAAEHGAPVPLTASLRQAAPTATTIHFSPQITIQGGNPEQIKGQVQEALTLSFAEFERLMQRYEAQKSRRSFG